MSNASATSERLQLQQLRSAESGKFLDNNVWNLLLSYYMVREFQNVKYILERSRGGHDNALRNAKTQRMLVSFCKYGASKIFAKVVVFVKETQYRYLENVHK